MKRTITGFLFAVIALLLSPSVSAQVKYQPEMDDFLGEWFRPRSYNDDEYTILISKRGDYVTVRMKSRPSYFLIENESLDDRYIYTDFESATFDKNKFTLYEKPYHPDIDVTWNLYFNNGQLEVYRNAVVKSENYRINQKYILYPNESNF